MLVSRNLPIIKNYASIICQALVTSGLTGSHLIINSTLLICVWFVNAIHDTQVHVTYPILMITQVLASNLLQACLCDIRLRRSPPSELL